MGTHGRRAFQKWFLGSVTLNILRKALVPILTVTHSDRPAMLPFKRILAATDLSEAASHGVDVAAALAPIFESRFAVVNVVADGLAGLSGLTGLVPSNIGGVTVRKQVLSGTPHEAVVRYAEGTTSA
jgi:nucleotide-binding universal stress UspA family protein